MSGFPVPLNTTTKFLLSTSGSQSSMVKHNTMLQHFGCDVAYYTFAHKITAEEYADVLRGPMMRGGAVTGQGLKTAIVPYLDVVDEYAKFLGAVNTVVNREGKLFGYNTDAYGFETAIHTHQEKTKTVLKTAVIYGNGGVSGVAYKILCKLGMKVTMRGRDSANVAVKMTELGIADFSGPFDLVVNATPVSSAPLKDAVGLETLLKAAKMIFDHSMPEKDGKNNYLASACESAGLHFIPGKDMYLPQMIQQWSLFLEGSVSCDTIRKYCEASAR